MERNRIELLCPARNVECGMAAIEHGADAVYIGAPCYSARKAAGNSVEDIGRLVRYAHLYGARVHVALNTLLRDEEVSAARRLAWELYGVGVDVLIVQDMSLLCGGMPPMELHASTQCDNRTLEKVRFWEKVGMGQVVLARELSIEEIGAIARGTRVRLEAFVHGALCVSYSGQCYMSLLKGGRSANRGECAQPCRLGYDVVGADGTVLMRRGHALSLKDNNQAGNIEELIDAGVSSFKIEGRLKDVEYVSNITLYYRQIIDEILSRRPDLERLSSGRVVAGFEARPEKSFNRGFTEYFAHGRRADIWQPKTSKSIGEKIGKVVKVGKGGVIEVRTGAEIANGDGLCYFGVRGLEGLKVNTAERVGRDVVRIGAQNVGCVREGDVVWRNADVAFEETLRHDRTERKIGVEMRLGYSGGSFELVMRDEEGIATRTVMAVGSEAARNREMMGRQMAGALTKLGGTAYEATGVVVEDSAAGRFVTMGLMNEMRRRAIEEHTEARVARHGALKVEREEEEGAMWPVGEIGREGNVINGEARRFYESHGARVVEWGYERQGEKRGVKVMTTRHCILNSLGMCVRRSGGGAGLLPLSIVDSDGKRYEVRVDCGRCEMGIWTE